MYLFFRLLTFFVLKRGSSYTIDKVKPIMGTEERKIWVEGFRHCHIVLVKKQEWIVYFIRGKSGRMAGNLEKIKIEVSSICPKMSQIIATTKEETKFSWLAANSSTRTTSYFNSSTTWTIWLKVESSPQYFQTKWKVPFEEDDLSSKNFSLKNFSLIIF